MKSQTSKLRTPKKSFSTNNLFSSMKGANKDKKLNNEYFTINNNKLTEQSTNKYSQKRSISKKQSHNELIKQKDRSNSNSFSSHGIKKRYPQQEIKGFSSKLLHGRQYQAQLRQAYRIIHFYEGKAIQLQKVIKCYQQILGKQHAQQWKQIQNFLTEQKEYCCELKGKNQQLNMQLRSSQKKFKLAQHRALVTSKKLALLMRNKSIIENEQQQSLKKNQQTQRKMHLQFIAAFQLKIQNLQQQFEFLRSENQNLERLNQQYRQQNQRLKKQLEQNNSNSSNLSIQKALKQFTNSKRASNCDDQRQMQFSTKASYSFTKEQQIQCDKIIKKLRYNLMRTNFPHFQLIKIMQRRQKSLSEQLCYLPFRLSASESQDLVYYFSQISQQKLEKALMRKIPVYKNFNRKKNTIAVQVSNSFKNRQDQVFNTLNLGLGKMTNNSMIQYFKKWELTIQHIDYIDLVHYERSGTLQGFDLNLVAHIFLSQ